MTQETDLRFDIDALFEHLISNLGHDLGEPLQWVFALRSADIDKLSQVESELSEEFATQLHEEVDEIDEEGERTSGLPMLMVVCEACLSQEEVKGMALRLSSIATERGLTYEGVECYDPNDDDDMFGWLDVEEAAWRMKQYMESGLPVDEELPWTFLILAQKEEIARNIASELESIGLEDIDLYDEPNEDGDVGLCLYYEGTNNEESFRKMCDRMDSIAKKHGGHLEGVQFFTRDQFDDLEGQFDLAEEE